MTTYHLKTVLFDFDGTLTPSLEFWLQAFRHALAQYERDLPEETIIRRLFYRDPDEVAEEFRLPSGAEFERHVHDGLALAFAAARLFPGVREVLDFCREADLPTGLVTSAPKRQVTAALESLGITRCFQTVVTGDDITHFKPHPEPVQKALDALRAAPEQTLFVGDYTADMLAGHAAGTRTALFLPEQHRRFYDFALLHATDPDFAFSAYRELLDHLRLHTGR